MATTEQAGRRRRRTAAKLGAVVALLAAVGSAVVWAGRGRSRADAPMTSDLALASRTTFDITTTATGELQAKNQIELRCELESESSIAELAPEGTFVHAGDLVVRLNVDQVQTQLDDEELRVSGARSDLVASEKGYEIQLSDNDSKIRQAALKLDLADLALSQWEKGEKVQKLRDIDLGLDKTEKDLARLTEKFASSENLFSQGFLSKNDRDLDEIALRDAKAAREKAVLAENTYKNYEMLKDQKQKTSDVEEARAELERTKQQAQIQLAIKEADKFSKKQQLARQEEKLEKLKKQVAAGTIKAPQDGLVVYATSAGRNWFDDSPFTVGRKVHPQETLIVLPDTSVMIAAVRVHESLAGRIAEGQTATVKIDAAAGQTFSGKVESIGVMAESQGRWMDPNRREYTVKIALDNTAGAVQLKPAMRCEATITLGRVDDAVTVPLQAVFTDEAVKFVYVPRGGKYARVPVKMGRRSETLAEVGAGLSPGERVLVREPAAGEVTHEAWEPAALKLAGFEVGADGKPMSPGGSAAAGGPPGDVKRVAGPPKKGAPKADAEKPKPEAAKPDAPKAAETSEPKATQTASDTKPTG